MGDGTDDGTGAGDATGTGPAGDGPEEPAPHRRHLHVAWILVVILVPLVLVAVGAIAVRQIEPPTPGAFYTPPSPLPGGAPGTIIRSEPFTAVPDGAVGTKVLYLSKGLDGRPIAVSGIIVTPAGPPPAGGRPVLAWAHPTTGVASRCAPSNSGRDMASIVPGLEEFLEAGYVVAATDYPGLGTPGPHPYLVGQSEGQAVLDSVRAARLLPAAGAGNRFAVWGHSQGGQAAIFTGQLAPAYAPELALVGVAAAAPATDLATSLSRDLGTLPGNVLGSFAVSSWSQVYPGAGADQIVAPESIPLMNDIAAGCIESEAQVLLEAPMAGAEKIVFLSEQPYQVQPWQSLFAENTPGDPLVPAPLFIAQGTDDTIVWADVTQQWAAQQCRLGQTIDWRPYPGVTHTDIAIDAAGDAASWIAARFAGGPAANTCPSVDDPLPSGTTTPSTVDAPPPTAG
jgi:alpha-beta hydrolase superfamily lysophospholipase